MQLAEDLIEPNPIGNMHRLVRRHHANRECLAARNNRPIPKLPFVGMLKGQDLELLSCRCL